MTIGGRNGVTRMFLGYWTMLYQLKPNSWQSVYQELSKLYSPDAKAKRTLQKVMEGFRPLARLAPTPADVGIETIHAIRSEMLNRPSGPCKPATVNSVLRQVRLVVGLLEKTNRLQVNPFRLGVSFFVREESKRRRKNAHHSLEEIGRLLRQADQELEDARGHFDRWKAARLRALVWLISHCGTRAKETLCVRTCRYDGSFFEVLRDDQPEGRLKTEESERLVAVPKAAALRVNEWVYCYLAGDERLFPCLEKPNTPWLNGNEKCRPVGQVSLLGERAGVPGVTLLSLRHSFQTHASQRFGLSPGEIKAVVGHSNTETQRHYIHEDRENLAAVMERVAYPV